MRFQRRQKLHDSAVSLADGGLVAACRPVPPAFRWLSFNFRKFHCLAENFTVLQIVAASFAEFPLFAYRVQNHGSIRHATASARICGRVKWALSRKSVLTNVEPVGLVA